MVVCYYEARKLVLSAVEFSVALMYLLLLFKRFGNDKTSQRMGIRILYFYKDAMGFIVSSIAIFISIFHVKTQIICM